MADVATLPGHADEVEENGADDYDGLGARSSENDDAEAELVAFCDLLTESFHDVDVEYTGFISSQVANFSLLNHACPPKNTAPLTHKFYLKRAVIGHDHGFAC